MDMCQKQNEEETFLYFGVTYYGTEERQGTKT